MRIAFIEVGNGRRFDVFKEFTIFRLGAPLLATILHERGYKVRVFVEDIGGVDWKWVRSADIICVSTLTSTAPRAYKIVKELRESGISVIMGGVHPTFLPEESLRFCDYVVRGEADETLPMLIDLLESKGKVYPIDIPGVSYMNNLGQTINNPLLPDHFVDLDELPAPDFELIYNQKNIPIYPLSTSRGCPFNCSFCSVVPMFGHKYRFRSVEKTVSDIKGIPPNAKIFFVDDNIGGNKARLRELCRWIGIVGTGRKWSAQVRTDVAKEPGLMAAMKEAGCTTLYVGLESINPSSLIEGNKKQKREDIVNFLEEAERNKINVHGMFVVGFDSDARDEAKKIAKFAREHGSIGTIQIMVLTPLPGTPFYEEMVKEKRIIHKEWKFYNGHRVVFTPKNTSVSRLQTDTLKGMLSFYNLSYLLKGLKRGWRENNWFYALKVWPYAQVALRTNIMEARRYLKDINKQS